MTTHSHDVLIRQRNMLQHMRPVDHNMGCKTPSERLPLALAFLQLLLTCTALEVVLPG